MDTSLTTYEAAMRDASGFLRRRDLASQDEAPLYFAWQRLYAAANANLSTDFLQETPVERRARLEARLAPRRGLPPPPFTSFDKVRRNSAHASAFLRSSTPSDNVIEMMARRYRREAEKLRGLRTLDVESPPLSPVDTTTKRTKKPKKKLKKSRTVSGFQVEDVGETSQEEQDASISPVKSHSVVNADKSITFTEKYSGSSNDKPSLPDEFLGEKDREFQGKATAVRRSSVAKTSPITPAGPSVVAPMSVFAARLSGEQRMTDAVEMMESSTASHIKGQSDGRGKNAWGTVKAASLLRAKYKGSEGANKTLNTTQKCSLPQEEVEYGEADEAKSGSVARSPRPTTAGATSRRSSQRVATNDAKLDDRDDETQEHSEHEMGPSLGGIPDRRSSGTQRRQSRNSTRRSSLASQDGVESKTDARRNPSVVSFVDELDERKEDEGGKLQVCDDDIERSLGSDTDHEHVHGSGNEEEKGGEEHSSLQGRSSLSEGIVRGGDTKGLETSFSGLKLSSHASGGLQVTRTGKKLVVTFEGEIDEDPVLDEDAGEPDTLERNSGRSQAHTINADKNRRRSHSSSHSASESETPGQSGCARRHKETHHWSQVKDHLREMTRQMQNRSPPERNGSSSRGDERTEGQDLKEQQRGDFQRQHKHRVSSVKDPLYEQESGRSSGSHEGRRSRVEGDPEPLKQQARRATISRHKLEEESESESESVVPAREHHQSARKAREQSAYESWARVTGEQGGNHAADPVREQRSGDDRRRKTPVPGDELAVEDTDVRRRPDHAGREEERQHRDETRRQSREDSDSLDDRDNQRYRSGNRRRFMRRETRGVGKYDNERDNDSDEDERVGSRRVREMRGPSLRRKQEKQWLVRDDPHAGRARIASTSVRSDGERQSRLKSDSWSRSRHEPKLMTSSGSGDEESDGWDPDKRDSSLENHHRVSSRSRNNHAAPGGAEHVARSTRETISDRGGREKHSLRTPNAPRTHSSGSQRERKAEREVDDDSDFYDDPCASDGVRQRRSVAGHRTHDDAQLSRARRSSRNRRSVSSHRAASSGRQRASVPDEELEESDADDLEVHDETEHGQGRHRTRTSTHSASRPERSGSRPPRWLEVPPAPFDVKPSRSVDRGASQNNQKRESVGRQRVELPEGIVWPPGMEDECIARLGLDGHHPMAPPGLEHLVTEQQWNEYWTWLHWYSSWQMWYAKNGKKSTSRKASSRPHQRQEEDRRADDRAKRRVSNANWWVDASPSNQHP